MRKISNEELQEQLRGSLAYLQTTYMLSYQKTIKDWLNSEGIDVNLRLDRQRTVLHLAAMAGDKEAVETLLAKGAKVDALDSHYKTPLEYAAKEGRKEVVKLLLTHPHTLKSKNAALYAAAFNGNQEIAEILLANGAEVQATEPSRGFTALHGAVCSTNVEMVKFLLDRGAKVDAEATSWYGLMPLSYAISGMSLTLLDASLDKESEFIKMLTCLLDNGADVNHPSSIGTPLEFAVKYDRKNIVRFLLQKGAKVDENIIGTAKRYSASEDIVGLLTTAMNTQAPVGSAAPSGMFSGGGGDGSGVAATVDAASESHADDLSHSSSPTCGGGSGGGE